MVVANEDVNPDAQAARISLSFKIHAGFDSPLLNFSGGNAVEVKRQIAAVFGFDTASEAYAEQTPFGLMVDAHDLARAAYVAHEALGATVDASKAKPYGGGGNWPKKGAAGSAPKEEAKPDPNAEIGALIARATTVKELQTVWIQHKTKNVSEHQGWPTPELMELANAKGREIAEKAAA